MSKNLGGTYESFVSRCIGGVRMEQETCRELADLAEELKFIEKWEQALGLQEGRRGYGASEKTGDAYAALPPLRSLVRQRKEALETQEAALIVKTEKALREAETAKNEAEKAVLKAAKEVGDTKEQKKQEQAKLKKEKDERDGCGGSLFFVFIVCLVASGIVYWLGERTVVPWLIFVPLAIVILFHMRKAWLNSEMDKKLNWLDASAARAEGMLKKRKKEAETAVATLKQKKREVSSVLALQEQRKEETEIKKWQAKVKSILKKLVDDMVPVPGKEFCMGKYEVTQAQWMAVMGVNPSHFKGADNPVECVTRDDCQVFLEKLNAWPGVKKAGWAFRLPTEEEWEFACRAGAMGEYCRLADETDITKDTFEQVAWFDNNSDGQTHPVGQKKPNACGLYDMLGNVWEWTASEVKGGTCVACGGSFDYAADGCTSGSRLRYWPDGADWYLGFRLAASGRCAKD